MWISRCGTALRNVLLFIFVSGYMWILPFVASLPIPVDYGVFPVDFHLNKTALASMKSFTAGSPCVDDNGQTRSPGESWDFGCERNYCHGGKVANFTLMYRCRTIGSEENINSINCRQVADTALSFPYCCPVIQCDERNMTATPSPPTCIDLSPDSACAVWSGDLAGCATTSEFYNFTSIYCRLTCGGQYTLSPEETNQNTDSHSAGDRQRVARQALSPPPKSTSHPTDKFCQ